MVNPANENGERREHEPPNEAGAVEQRLADLDASLHELKGRRADSGTGARRGHAMGMALRVMSELVAGILVGVLIGWQLDAWLGTSPVLLLIFFVLGAAAGVLTVIRTTSRMQGGATSAADEGSEPGS